MRYQLDNGQTLAAIAGENTTFYLYGRGVIGTFHAEWSYILQDGAGSMRQLAKPDGAVALSVSYTPWGDTLEVYGTGMLDIGYLGGVYDAGTGLIYMGNGQYYDPSTGRFLTRGAQPDQSNPYTPWNNDPSGMLIAPLALLALVFGRKKNRTKLDHFVILIVIGLSVGLSVSACGGVNTPKVQIFITPITTPSSTAMSAQSGNDTGDYPEQSFFEVVILPMLNDCRDQVNNDAEFEIAKRDLLNIIESDAHYSAQLQGLEPDYRGIFIAAYYKDIIEKKATGNVTPMMVAVGIAIQSNFMDNAYDQNQQYWYDNFFGLFKDKDAGFGLAQATDDEFFDYFKEHLDQKKAGTGIEIMIRRIEKVLSYNNSYDGNGGVTRCSPTDQMIFAIFAQQSKSYDPSDVLSQYNGTIYAVRNDRGSYTIKWEDYFRDTYNVDRKENSGKENSFNDTIAGGRDYMTQFMLLRAVNNIHVFEKYHIFERSPDYNLELMENLANMRWN